MKLVGILYLNLAVHLSVPISIKRTIDFASNKPSVIRKIDIKELKVKRHFYCTKLIILALEVVDSLKCMFDRT